eukprot:TRINITY_DN12672_c0_g1_i1.p4 TRINITY_DN12672_c0_g1~~TRINITY_DN12672_c0_g1_i1.p4  ORF type:complete len:179 (+),score=11.45 TRINITY_DN12672_c0_g1_i1:61-597(+)
MGDSYSGVLHIVGSCSDFYYSFFFFNDTATTEIYTLHIVGSVRCVQETGINAEYMGIPYDTYGKYPRTGKHATSKPTQHIWICVQKNEYTLPQPSNCWMRNSSLPKSCSSPLACCLFSYTNPTNLYYSAHDRTKAHLQSFSPYHNKSGHARSGLLLHNDCKQHQKLFLWPSSYYQACS